MEQKLTAAESAEKDAFFKSLKNARNEKRAKAKAAALAQNAELLEFLQLQGADPEPFFYEYAWDDKVRQYAVSKFSPQSGAAKYLVSTDKNGVKVGASLEVLKDFLKVKELSGETLQKWLEYGKTVTTNPKSLSKFFNPKSLTLDAQLLAAVQQLVKAEKAGFELA